MAVPHGALLAADAALLYFPEPVAVTMTAIAGAESSFNPGARGGRISWAARLVNRHCGGFTVWGLWQIHLSAHWQTLRSLGAPTYWGPCAVAWWLSYPRNNARAAYVVWLRAGRSFRPWEAYTLGAWRRWLPVAQQAIAEAKRWRRALPT